MFIKTSNVEHLYKWKTFICWNVSTVLEQNVVNGHCLAKYLSL